jgi:hypothetical protein
MIAAIVSLSTMPAIADFREDRGIMSEVDSGALVRIEGNVEVRSMAGSLSDEQLDAFAALAEKGAADIARFTGVEAPKQRIVIYLSPRVGISHTYTGSARHQPRVFIDSNRVPDQTAPYLHELVHAVVGDGGIVGGHEVWRLLRAGDDRGQRPHRRAGTLGGGAFARRGRDTDLVRGR